MIELFIAFGAGLISFLSPCVLPLIPGYISYISGSSLNELIEKNEIGMLMLKLVEIIGSDDVENLDPETLYFIVSLLNKAKIKKVRNKILNLTLPLRV